MQDNTLTLPIEGMTCASCSARVERALQRVPGVQQVSVNLASESAAVELDAPVGADVLSQAVEKAGYTVPREQAELRIDGMTCATCVARVEKALKAVPGVIEASVNLATSSAQVSRLAGTARTMALLQAVQRAGYEAAAADSSGAAPAPPRRNHDPGWKVALAVALSAPLVLPMLGDLFGRHWMLPALWQFVLATPVQFWLGARFYRAGWSALRAGTGNMDLLVALGTSAAFGLSLVLFGSVTWIGVQSLGYVEINMAGRLLLGGGFRRMLIGQLVLRNFEDALAVAKGEAEIWDAVRGTARELGFDRVEMELRGERREERMREGLAAAEWTAEVPLPGGDWVKLTRPFDATTHQAAMGPFLDTLRKGLIHKRIELDGEQRARAAGA